MEGIIRLLARARSGSALYAATFLLWLHLFFVGYVNSTFMAGIVGERGMGLLFILGSLLAFGGHALLPRAIAAVGNFRTALGLTLLELAALAALASPLPRELVVAAFLLHVALVPLLLVVLDVFIEAATVSEGVTGGVRGAILTTANAAVLVAPLLIGALAGGDAFERVYAGAFAIFALFLLLLILRFRRFPDPAYDHATVRDVLRTVRGDADLGRTALLYLFLRIFFTFMVIYTPLYLRTVVGFSWEEIGVMFTIMLIPLVAFELPFGKIADRFLGEKELLVAGFLVMAGSAGAMGLLEPAGFAAWTAALFASRVGAAAVESMTETHFFRRVGSGNAGLIGLFRLAIPAATVATPLAAIAILAVASMNALFFGLSLLMLLGAVLSLFIADSK